MTVTELIAELKKHDPTAEVVMCDSDTAYHMDVRKVWVDDERGWVFIGSEA